MWVKIIPDALILRLAISGLKLCKKGSSFSVLERAIEDKIVILICV